MAAAKTCRPDFIAHLDVKEGWQKLILGNAEGRGGGGCRWLLSREFTRDGYKVAATAMRSTETLGDANGASTSP